MPAPTSTDSNFERTFANLAFSRMQDKAPMMLDYLIGFQLIDKNEDETHAVGVFGFKVGDEYVYAPVFFINGELKGHELMYIRSEDRFIPMTEEGVNHILNRRPQILGKEELTPRSALGIRQPDFNLFARVPYVGSKYAAAPRTFNQICETMQRENPDFVPFMDVFLQNPAHGKYASLNVRFDLRHALRRMGKKAAFVLVNTMRHDEKFADAILKFYDIKDLLDFEKCATKVAQENAEYQEKAAFNTCRECQHYQGDRSCEVVAGQISPNGTSRYYEPTSVKNEIQPISPIKAAADGDTKIEGTAPKVVVILRGDDHTNLMQDLSDEDKRRLLRDNYIVKDERSSDHRARVYKTQIATTYTSPTEDGYCEVAAANGGTRRVFISTAPINIGSAGAWHRGECLVVDPERNVFGIYPTQDIMVSKHLENGEWRKLFDSNFSGMSGLKPDDVAAIVTPCGQVTAPFRVDKKWTNPEGQTEFKVHTYYLQTSGSSMFAHKNYGAHSVYDSGPQECALDTIVLTGKDGENITQIGSTLFVPRAAKACKLNKEFKNSFGGTMDLGVLPEVMLKIYKTASAEEGVHRLEIRTDGIQYTLTKEARGKIYNTKPMSKLAALRFLILAENMGQEDAEAVVKSAAPRQAGKFFVKESARAGFEAYGSQPLQAEFKEPQMGDEWGIRAPVQYPFFELQNLGSSDTLANREHYRNDVYIDDAAKQYAQQASETGQKELLDTSVITGLVKTMDVEGSVNGYISDLEIGLDRVGRILFMYYWHNDKFKDRYGQQDMVQLEDNLRNVFKNLGELVLFLKQKTIQPDRKRMGDVKLQDVLV